MTAELVTRTEIIDVYPLELHATVSALPLPDALDAEFSPEAPDLRMTDDRIYIRFRNTVRYVEPLDDTPGDSPDAPDDQASHDSPETDPARIVGEVHVTHVVEMSYVGDTPTRDDVTHMAFHHTLPTAYPYIRADIQRCSTSVGLPSLVLPFLKRPTREADSVPTDEDDE